jgi:ParB family chromosome partitioning protein
MPKSDISAILSQRARENSDSDSENSTAEYDALFGIGDKRPEPTVTKLPLIKLVPYSAHPFRPYTKDKLFSLAKSIKECGLHHPIIVRPLHGGKYEILAGHNRTEAFRLNGEAAIPAIIVNVGDCEAAMIVTETNLRQRERLLHSEKAFAYKLQLDAMKHQGKKTTDETSKASNANALQTSAQIARKSESAQELADEHSVGKDDIRRHIRLTYLIRSLLALVDDGNIPFIAGVDLSYLDDRQQNAVHQYFHVVQKGKINVKTARAIREWAQAGKPLNGADDVEKCLGKTSHKRDGPKNTVTLGAKAFAPYLARIPQDTNLESLFLEFLKERFG